MELDTQQVISSDGNLDTLGAEIMDLQPMTYILGKFQQNFMDFLLVFQVCGTGDAVTNGFYRAYKIPVHNTGVIRAIGISP